VVLNAWGDWPDLRGLDGPFGVAAPGFTDDEMARFLAGLQPASCWLFSDAFVAALMAWKFRKSAESIVRARTEWLRDLAATRCPGGPCLADSARCPVTRTADLLDLVAIDSQSDVREDIRAWAALVRRRGRLDVTPLTPEVVSMLSAWSRAARDPILCRPDSLLANPSVTVDLLARLDPVHSDDRLVLGAIGPLLAGGAPKLRMPTKRAGWGVRGLLAGPLLNAEQRGRVLLAVIGDRVAGSDTYLSPQTGPAPADVVVDSSVLPGMLRRRKRMAALGCWMRKTGITPILDPGVTDEIEGTVVNEVLGAETESDREGWELWLRAVRGKPAAGASTDSA
jgi:hypothetical protein